MNVRWIAIGAVAGIAALPSLADAASQLTATGVRIGDHPAYVRVVIDFNGRVRDREVEAGRFAGRAPSMATVRVTHPRVTTLTTGRTGYGVRVALQPGTQMLHVTMNFARDRLKYLSYAVVTGNRLAIDLWKSAPPAKPTRTCRGLSLRSWHVTPGVITVSGHERGIFENTFRVVVRGANGKMLGRRTVVDGGPWSTTVAYRAIHRQPGTLEAVAFSPKDGALACIAQVRVALPKSPRLRAIPRD